MIKITEDQTYFGGNEFELFKDLMRFHAVIMKNKELMKINMMAMEGVKQAIKDGMLDEIAGEKRK